MKLRALWLWSILIAVPSVVLADQSSRPDLAGEAFGQPVPMSQFAYFYKTAALFSRTGEQEPTKEQTEGEAWQNLILLHQADQEGIAIGRTELTNELKRLLDARGVVHGGPEYPKWVQATMGEPAPVFERRIEELLKINTLVRRHAEPEVTVTEEEVTQKHLNQQSSFECEYVRFETASEADEFARQAREQPALWKTTFERKRTEEGQKGAAWINIMSLEALIDLWEFPKDDAYRILGEAEGSFIRARHTYGEVVVRLLYKQVGDLTKLTDAKREELRKALTHAKRYKISKEYFDDLTARAALKNYIQERREAEEHARQQALLPTLKAKALIMLETSRGPIGLRLWPEVAPLACENFIGLVEKGYYNGLTFHRVKKEFMIQGGDPTGTGSGGESLWGKPFEDEVSESVTFDRPGLLAMANSGPGTNGSQFFITTVATTWLNGRHTIFGEVVSGLEAVKQIEATPTDASDKPLEAQQILKAFIKPPA